MIRVATLGRVPLLVHWSVFVLCSFFLGAGLRYLAVTAAAIAAYLAVVLFHELGHHIVAVRRHYHVDRIEVYPLHALCHFEEPEYALDAAMIAAGGPIAQLILAAPFFTYLITAGFTASQPVNAVLAIFGFWNVVTALFNLIPVAPLDGKKAWTLIPLMRDLRRWKRTRDTSALNALEDALKKARKQ